ncbi:MAG TPA: S8 family serine peptidase [Blastocatellia bacterium]|nr:S8 family serine peptidase [Blastocatellia bacterium]
MKKYISILCAVCLIALLLTSARGIHPATSHAQDEAEAAHLSSEFARGRVLVKVRSGISASRTRRFLSRQEALDVEEIAGTRIRILHLPEGADEKALVQSLESQPEVEFAELDYLVPPAEVTPNDPDYASQWHLPMISSPAAWSSTSGSSSVIIAILDTGVDASHPDLAPKITPGWNFWDNNANTNDVYGHGTAVAGTAAAAANNGLGVASVAWNCRIMPIRISSTNGSASISAIANGLAWAADRGARVANISYRVTNYSVVRSAAQYFQSRGGVVVVAAGNDSLFDSSSDNPYVLTVSATDGNDNLASFSNTGNNVDLAAPGVSIDTTNQGGGYGFWGGTSFSAPIVAGVAALVVSANQNLSGGEIQDVLKQSSDDRGAAGWDPAFGWGRVNAAHAVASALGNGVDNTAPTVNINSPSSGIVLSGMVAVDVAASDNVAVASVTFSVDGVDQATLASAPYAFAWDTNTASNGPHILAATARDAAGNQSSRTVSVAVDNRPEAAPPQVAITSPANGANVNGSVPVLVNVTGGVPIIRVELYVDGVLKSNSTTIPFANKWVAKKAAAGAHTLQCKAYDMEGRVAVSTAVTVNR